ncbi:50S ribosomal protein L21 [Candidatus Gottesmanbacteria bacterium]|nr:50S ribosomal protein L21 [Candidatus Gottesmanbacteria bacterium]
MFAVVEISGKQYKVSQGDTVVVAKVAGAVGDMLTFDSVKLVSDEKSTKLGKPTVKGAKVTAKVVSQGKGEKLDVRRFKAKVRERRHIGFRPQVTTLEIVTISA